MFAVTIIDGEGRNHRGSAGGIAWAVGNAKRAGFVVGRRVNVGSIAGRVLGYNIANEGIYHGALYPLLVVTPFGLAKCSQYELRLID